MSSNKNTFFKQWQVVTEIWFGIQHSSFLYSFKYLCGTLMFNWFQPYMEVFLCCICSWCRMYSKLIKENCKVWLVIKVKVYTRNRVARCLNILPLMYHDTAIYCSIQSGVKTLFCVAFKRNKWCFFLWEVSCTI